MPPPRVTPWSDTVEVTVNADIAAEVHIGTDPEFVPGAGTYRGTLNGPGTLHVTDTPPGVDLYVRLVAPGGEAMSGPSDPVQTVAIL